MIQLLDRQRMIQRKLQLLVCLHYNPRRDINLNSFLRPQQAGDILYIYWGLWDQMISGSRLDVPRKPQVA